MIIGGVLALIVALGMIGTVMVFTNHGMFGMQTLSSSTGYYHMTDGNNGTGGMMGNGNGLGTSQGTPVIGMTNVAMTNHDTFSPSIIQVKVGTTVTWTNADTDTHTVTFMPMMSGGSNNVGNGATFSQTFSSAGTYYYRCLYHQSMIGEVIVTG